MTTGNRWLAMGLVALMAAAPAAGRQSNDRVQRLATQLDLTDGQIATLRNEMGDGSSLWSLSAALQSTLNDDQKQQLFELGAQRRAFDQGVRQGRRQALAANRRAGQGRAARWAGARGVQGDRGTLRARANRRGEADGTRQPVMDRMLESMTDEQKAAFTELREANRERMKALRTAHDNGELDRAQLRTELRELRTAMRSEADKILTEEQKARMKELQDRRSPRQRTEARRPREARSSGAVGVRGRGVGSGSGEGVVRPRGPRSGQAGVMPNPQRMRSSSAGEMVEALGLTETQAETMRIHAALSSSLVRPRIAQRMGRPRR